MISSLERNESRGSHQRSDFLEIDKNYNLNMVINLKNGQLEIKKQELIKLPLHLASILENSFRDS